MYVMVDFICMGLLELQETQTSKKYKKYKFLPTMGFESSTFHEADALRIAPWDLIHVPIIG